MTRVGVHTSNYTKVTIFFPRTLQKAEQQTNIRVLLNEWPQSIPREQVSGEKMLWKIWFFA